MRELIPTSVVPLDTVTGGRFELGQRLSWRDPDVGATLVLSQPAVDPDLWAEFSLGAQRSYTKHGVECALDVDALRSGADTIMFFAMIDDAGRLVGGLRAKGPLRSADDSHAVVEWAGQPGQQAVRDMITDRIPFGVLELKAGWVIDDPDRNRSLIAALARSGCHITALLDCQFMMATAAAHVLNRWRTAGGVVAPVPAAPYPDDRYHTKMIWWDRRDFVKYAEPQQAAKILVETQRLTQEFYSRRDTEFAARNVG
jgi:hypothetical protein